jgi:hypothetical protein
LYVAEIEPVMADRTRNYCGELAVGTPNVTTNSNLSQAFARVVKRVNDQVRVS